MTSTGRHCINTNHVTTTCITWVVTWSVRSGWSVLLPGACGGPWAFRHPPPAPSSLQSTGRCGTLRRKPGWRNATWRRRASTNRSWRARPAASTYMGCRHGTITRTTGPDTTTWPMRHTRWGRCTRMRTSRTSSSTWMDCGWLGRKWAGSLPDCLFSTTPGVPSTS